MASFTRFKKIFQQIQVVRSPRHRLSTFGETCIQYTLVTDVAGWTDRSRLRKGSVTAEKPAIITHRTLRDKFRGFGSEAADYASMLGSQYGEALHALEYNFKNESISNNIELVTPDQLIQKLAHDFDRSSSYRESLIRGTDKLWELSVMKLIIEETLSSFGHNVQELRERGFFEGELREANRQHREIKNLIRKARADQSYLKELGKKLKEYNLFESYQDEFFSLVR